MEPNKVTPSDYALSLPENGWCSLDTAKIVVDILDLCAGRTDVVPQVAPGPNGMVGITFNSLHATGDHFAIEIFADGHLEAFREDDDGAESVEGDGTLEEFLSWL